MSARTIIETEDALERARGAALAHTNYGWTKSPGTHGKEPWSDDQHDAYHTEWDKAHHIENPRYTGQVGLKVLPVDIDPGLRAKIRAKAVEFNTAFSKVPLPSYRAALERARKAVKDSGYEAYLDAYGYV